MGEESPADRSTGVRLGPGALCLDEPARDLPLFAAAVEAYRLPRQSWGACLDGIAGLGFELIEVRAPWSVYERGTGQLDLAGTRPHPQGWSRDLLGFLAVCQERQLAVILAPGPVLGRSVPAGGVPERLWVDPTIGARGPQGEPLWVPQAPCPFVQPSLASPVFVDAAAEWLRGLAEALAPLAHPAGPLVALRLTMQPGSLGRRGVYDGDYHPEAIARYRAFLAERYPDGLPSAYGAVQLDKLEPPRRVKAEPRRVIDWLRFKGALESEALIRVAAAGAEAGLGALPVLTAQPLGVGDGWATADAERHVAASGLELALLRPQPALERRAFERLVGSSRLPHLAELPWGSSCYWGPPELEVQEQRALRALMAGVRGMVFEAVIAHDERVGAPLGLDGRPADTQAHEATRRVLALARDLQLHRNPRAISVGLLERRDERCEVLAQGLLGPALPGSWAALGLEPEALTEPAPASLLAQAAAALDAAGVAYERLTDELETARWQRCAALVVAGPLDEASSARLADYEAAGGQVFALDEDHAPAELPKRLRSAGFDRPVVRLREPAGALRCLVCLPGEGDGAIFLENSGDEARRAELMGIDELKLWDAYRGAPLRDGTLELAAGEVRVLRCRKRIVERDDTSGAQSEGASS